MIPIGQEVQLKKGGPAIIVIGNASSRVECRWYDGHSVKREVFSENELRAVNADRNKLIGP